MKIRIKFAKEGTMKFIGHLDIMRYFQKVMRRADVNIRYSEGFSPHQIMSFAAPLGVGVTSRGEYVDIEVQDTDSSKEMLRRINEVMVDGLEAISYRLLPDTAANAMSIVAAADYSVSFREGKGLRDWNAFAKAAKELLSQDEILVLKKTKRGEKEADIRPMIYDFKVREQDVWMCVATGSAANLKPDMVIRAIFEKMGEPLQDFALLIHREEVYADLGGEDGRRLQALEDFGEDIE